MTVRTYYENGDGSSRTFSQQFIQLLFGEGVHNETEDKEERKENSQSPAHERVKTDAFVVSHISPVCVHREGIWFDIKFTAFTDIFLDLSG